MKRIIAALFSAVMATSAFAATPPQFSDLRQDYYPWIDEALAAAGANNLHGTFNRLSALYNRSPIDTAVPDAGHDGELPENFLWNLEATLVDLQEDLAAIDLTATTYVNELYLLQLVRTYVVRRPLELWESNPPATCFPLQPCPTSQPELPCHTCVENDSPTINEVESTVDAANALYAAVYDTMTPAQQAQVSTPDNLSTGGFNIDLSTMISIKGGVESIDD